MTSSQIVDTQLSDMVTGSDSCGTHAIKRAREYAATVHFIGLLAGVGPGGEVKEARATVMRVLSDIGFDGSDGALRRNSLEKAAEWKKLAYAPTGQMSPSERAAHQKKVAEAMEAWNEAAKPLAEKYSPSAVFGRLWNSIKKLYNDAIQFIREDMWKVSLCKLSVDAGFLLLETGVAVALSAMGMAAAAALLKIVAIASKSYRFVKISVLATRTGKSMPMAGAAKQAAERTFKHEIDTGKVNKDASSVLNENGQGGQSKDKKPRDGEDESAKPTKKEDERADGSYRNPDDPPGVRRDANGEAMVQNSKTGEWGKISSASNNAKGNFGETMADKHMASQGYTKLNGPNTQIGDGIDKGIDGVYHKPGGNPPYVIADAKYGSAGLGTVKGGIKQMSPRWINDRLVDAVGPVNARKIGMQGHSSRILKVDKNGKVIEKSLDTVAWRDHEK